MKEAVLYCRVSTKKQTKGHGLQRQLDRGIEWAERNGYYLVAVFSEFGSDFEGKSKLPARTQAQRVASYRGCPVLIEDWDRWSRNCSFPECKVIEMGISDK